MEIYVEGSVKKSFKPDEVKMNFTFTKKDKTYQNVLENGCEIVEDFIKFMESLGFNKTDLKTKSFSVRENSIYDENTRKYIKDGFVFMQEMTLVYEYDVKRFAEVLEEMAENQDAPNCRITFGLKDMKSAEKTLFEACVKDAKEQAEIIAKASGLKLTKCEKVSCEPINMPFESSTNLERAKMCCSKISDSIQTTFVPEDINVSNTLYVVWRAE